MSKFWALICVLMNVFTVGVWLSLENEPFVTWSSFAVSLAITASVVWIYRVRLRNYVLSTFFKRVLNEAVTISLVACSLTLLCYLGYKNFYQWDMTSQKFNTLSDQTRVILKELNRPIEIELFARREEWNKYMPWLELYRAESSNITLTAIDTNLHPHLARANGILENGTVKITSKDKSVLVMARDELSITNALLKMIREQKLSVYFAKGHGELSINDISVDGISELKRMIENSAYIVKEIDFSKTKEIPADMHSLVILGPKSDFKVNELDLVGEYLNRGGKIVAAFGPMFSGNNLNGLYSLLKRWGVKVNNDLVVDRLSPVAGADATVPMVTAYDEEHAITKRFTGRTIFPLSASLEQSAEGKALDGQFAVLAKTSAFPASWAETNFESVKSGKITFDASEKKGPIALAVSMDVKHQSSLMPNTRLVVFGTSSFLVNGYLAQTPNYLFFLNALSWSMEDEGLIAIQRPGLPVEERFFLSQGQVNLLFYSSVMVLPILLFLWAIFLYKRRQAL